MAQDSGDGTGLGPHSRSSPKLGWILPCKDGEELDDMSVFFKDMFGMAIADQGQPLADTGIQRFTKMATPHGSLNLVEPHWLRKNQIHTGPMLSITVNNLANACKNLDSRKVKLVAPVYHASDAWAIVYYEAPDGRLYEIKGPYLG